MKQNIKWNNFISIKSPSHYTSALLYLMQITAYNLINFNRQFSIMCLFLFL